MEIFGAMHFMGADGMAGMVPIPGGVIWVYVSGVALILAAVAIFLGKMDKLACVLLAVLLLLFVVLIHVPNAMSADAATKQMGMISAMKDLALMGGALMCAGQSRDNSVIG
jgi:uncharacterized membrane protein YphA (DoxX/SURF4 family)